jgi:hypothetical protein
VAEEIEIVHGHHLRGPRGRDQQRTLAVHHVVRARQPFHRRPLQPIPRPHQPANRDFDVRDFRGRHFNCKRRGRPVFPGVGEQRHGRCHAVARAGAQGFRKFMYELADTGPFAQSRTVVDQEPHSGNSTMLAFDLLGVE